MKKDILAAALVAAFGIAGLATAHENHGHKVMGKVVAVDDKRIELEGKDGKKVTGLLGPKTMFMNGKVMAKLADVKVGQRVVVTIVQEKEKMNVTEILLGVTEKPTPKPVQPKH